MAPTSVASSVERRREEKPYNGNAETDVEQGTVADAHLRNTTVQTVTWSGVTVTVKDRETKEPKKIVDNVEGLVEAGKSWVTQQRATHIGMGRD